MDFEPKLMIKRLDERATLPRYATAGSAGMDLTAVLDEPLTIEPAQICRVPTGLAIALPSNRYVALVFARSGLASKHGITLANAVGVVDSDYRGEIQVPLTNISREPYTIQNGDRIAQLMIAPVATAAVEEVAELPDSARGEGGFGSTGR